MHRGRGNHRGSQSRPNSRGRGNRGRDGRSNEGAQRLLISESDTTSDISEQRSRHHQAYVQVQARQANHGRSVNDMLEQSRREQAGTPSISTIRRIQDTYNVRTLPPEEREAMNIPETMNISARRSRPRLPQETWQRVYHATDIDSRPPVPSFNGFRERPDRFSHLLESEFRNLPLPGSLKIMALRKIAKLWSIFMHDSEALKVFTSDMSTSLLALISLCGPDRGLSTEVLRKIFKNTEQTKVLDFNGLLSSDFDFLNLIRFVTKAPKEKKGKLLTHENASWEELLELSLKDITVQPTNIPFLNLTHLGLGNPGSHASWSQLLSLAPHIRGLTHLSLANWPTPHLGPTPALGTYSRLPLPSWDDIHAQNLSLPQAQRIVNQCIGEYFTTRIDEFKEAARVLDTLSRHLFNLQYLDLEGCWRWIPALAWKEKGLIRPGDGNDTLQGNQWALDIGQLNYVQKFVPAIAKWWAHLAKINVSQGWIPGNQESIERMADTQLRSRLQKHLTQKSEAGQLSPPINPWKELSPDPRSRSNQPTLEDYTTLIWMAIEDQIRHSVHRAHLVRNESTEVLGSITYFDSLEADLGMTYTGVPEGFNEDLRIRQANSRLIAPNDDILHP
jgi:hypothetical protein